MSCVASKDPQDLIDRKIDWEAWLDGDTIESSSWMSSPAGLTLSLQSFTPTYTIVWIQGGVAGVLYRVVNTIITAGGRAADKTINVIVENH